MKLTLFLLLCLCCTACIHPKEGEYIIPERYTVKDREDFIAQYKVGKIVYAHNCAGCHNQKGKEPNFLPNQLESYLLRVKPRIHSGSLTAQALTDEEIKKVVLYLHNNHKQWIPKNAPTQPVRFPQTAQ